MIYLASQSPQRTRLLSEHGIDHIIVTSRQDEAAVHHPLPAALAAARARAKARSADLDSGRTDWRQGDAVLGADTVVALGNRVFGKPRCDDEAAHTLAALAGNTHTVITAHCLWTPTAEVEGLAFSRVLLRALSRDEIAAYVATGESRGRAGAYAIQGAGGQLVECLQGDFDTVVGLNVRLVRSLYDRLVGPRSVGPRSVGPRSVGPPTARAIGGDQMC